MRIDSVTRIFHILSVCFICFGCNSCHQQKASTGSPAKRLVVIKYATHPALDELEKGLLDEINTFKSNRPDFANLQVDLYNANGNPQRAKDLAQVASREGVNAILAIATPAAQAVSRTDSHVPLLYGAVADPVGAGIIPSPRATGIQNVDAKTISDAVKLMKKLKPSGVRRIGTLFNPGEQNSEYVQKILQTVCDTENIELVQRHVTNTSQIANMTESLCSEVDIIYSANDNTVNAGIASLVAVINAKKVPFVIGDLSTLSAGATAAVGLEYYAMGKDLAGMTIELLSGKTIATLPPKGAPKASVWLNENSMKAIGLEITPELRASSDKIIKAE